jgi:diguanylate cyclase (GGDEF)-like protein
MSGIDLRSINLMTGIMCVVMGTVILGMRHNFPATIKGLGLWGLGPLLGMLAALFYGMDGLLPPGLATMGGNALAISSSALMYFGSQRFFEQKVRWQFWAGLGAMSLGALTYFALVQPDYRMRVAVFTGTLAFLFAAHTRLLLRHGRGFAARFAAVIAGLQTLVFSIRLVAVYWVDSADANRFTASPIHTAYFISFSFMVLLFLVGVLLMASERVRAEFEHLATYDSLTGALNRRVIRLAGEQELIRWQRYRQSFAVLMLDIDHFKQINDQHGHQMGDQVLQQLVTTVRKPLRKTDLLGRHGGEEFLILLAVTDGEMALALSERIRSAVETTPIGPVHQACTISIGVACVSDGDASFDALVSRADSAMYEAKALGRNRVVMFDDAAVSA